MAEFWANPGTEPKRIYRWVMRLNVPDIAEYMVKKVSRPSWSVSESTHAFLNHTFYYPGRVEYDEMSVTLIDSISPNAAVVMRNLLDKAGYVLPSNAETNFRTISKEGYVSNAGLGNVTLTLIDQDGGDLESYTLHNAWIKNCNLNEVDYESDDLLNIDITMRYDWFTMSAPGSSPSVTAGFQTP